MTHHNYMCLSVSVEMFSVVVYGIKLKMFTNSTKAPLLIPKMFKCKVRHRFGV